MTNEVYKNRALERMLEVSMKYHKGIIPYSDLKALWIICTDPKNHDIENNFTSSDHMMKRDLHKYLRTHPLDFIRVCDAMKL